MITFSEAQIMAWLSPILWPFLRVLALFSVAPVFSMRVIPMRVKIGLAFLVALCAQGVLGDQPVISVNGREALGAVAQQVADGLLDVGPLVVAGHHQGHLGIARQHQPGSGKRYVPPLPLEVVIETTTNPHHGHQTGIGQRKDGYPFQKILHRSASPWVALAALIATGVTGSWVG